MNHLSSHKKTEREIKCSLLNEKNQSVKAICYLIQLCGMLKRQNYRDSERKKKKEAEEEEEEGSSFQELGEKDV